VGQEVAPRERFGHSFMTNVILLTWSINILQISPKKVKQGTREFKKQKNGENLQKKTIGHVSKLMITVTV
jgi:hypothetical protein